MFLIKSQINRLKINMIMLIMSFSMMSIFLSQKTDVNYKIQSMNGKGTISPFAQDLISKSSFSKGRSVSSSFGTNLIFGDFKESVIAEVSKQNGDIGTDLLNLEGIFRNGDYMSVKDYYINYTLSNNKYHSHVPPTTYNKLEADDYQVGCNYKSNDVTLGGNSFQNEIEKLVSYSFLTFAIMKNQTGISLVKYDNNSITFDAIDNYMANPNLLNETSFNELWIINQPYIDEAYLVLQQNKTKNLIYYQIKIESETNWSLSLHSKMNYDNFNSTQLTKIGKYKNDFILGTLDRGLMIMSLIPGNTETTQYKPSRIIYNLTEYFFSVQDFLINEKTMYVINKNVGLVILDLNNNYNTFNNQTTFFNHPNLQKMDFINNPFMGSKYIGIGIEKGGVNEFFLEFLIDDEYNPQLNKILTSDELIIYNNFYTVDKFYTYMFNQVSNKLIIMRRGMLNSIPSEIVYADMSGLIVKESFTIGNNIMMNYIYDYTSKKVKPILRSESNFLILNQINFPLDTLNCKFAKNGVYNVTMSLKGEVCKQSLDSDYLYTSCDKMINFTYYIYGDSSDDTIGLIVGVVVACFVIFVIGVMLIVCKTNCFKEMDNIKIKSELNQKREELYKEDLSCNINNYEQLLERKPSEMQLGTEFDGKVYGNIIEGSHDNSHKTPNNADVHVNVNNDNEFESLKRIELERIEKEKKSAISVVNNVIFIDDSHQDNYNIMTKPAKSLKKSQFKKNKNKSSSKNELENPNVNFETENIQVNKKEENEDLNQKIEENLNVNLIQNKNEEDSAIENLIQNKNTDNILQNENLIQNQNVEDNLNYANDEMNTPMIKINNNHNFNHVKEDLIPPQVSNVTTTNNYDEPPIKEMNNNYEDNSNIKTSSKNDEELPLNPNPEEDPNKDTNNKIENDKYDHEFDH